MCRVRPFLADWMRIGPLSRLFGLIVSSIPLLVPEVLIAQNPVVMPVDPTDPRGMNAEELNPPEPVVLQEIDEQPWLPEFLIGDPEFDFETAENNERPKPTANITVELQSDFGWFTQDSNNEATVGDIPTSGASFRRSRLGVFGELYQTVEYRAEWDFAGDGRPRFLDNWIALTDVPLINNAIVGHFFEPFSLERYTPNRFMTFTERSLADTFAPARNMGIMVYGNSLQERWTWAGGVFRSNSDEYGDHVTFNDDLAVTLHSTFLAWFEEDDEFTRRLLHIGASGSMRHPGDERVRFAARPSARMREQGVGGIPTFVDTGDLLDVRNYWLYGLEAAWVHGPLSLQGEWINATVDRTAHEDPTFQGAYVFGSWFLTGESRSYSPTSVLGRFREGIFQRVTPRTNVFDRTAGSGWTGCGAIELAVRWAFIDLNDGGVDGGRIEEMTYGLNWYLNPYTKIVMNYVRPTLIDPVTDKSEAELYVVRFQFEF